MSLNEIVISVRWHHYPYPHRQALGVLCNIRLEQNSNSGVKSSIPNWSVNKHVKFLKTFVSDTCGMSDHNLYVG